MREKILDFFNSLSGLAAEDGEIISVFDHKGRQVAKVLILDGAFAVTYGLGQNQVMEKLFWAQEVEAFYVHPGPNGEDVVLYRFR